MKSNRIIFLLFVITAVIFTSVSCASPSKSANNEAGDTIRLLLDWAPNTNHTGFFVALDKGYYQESGFSNVEITQPPEEEALVLLAAGKAEFAVSFQESMGPALSTASPMPVTAVAAMIQHNTSGILSLKSAGIESPKGLMGKRYATWGTEFVDEVLRAIVEADGGVFQEVQMIPNSAVDAVSAVQTDIDAIWVYYGWEGIAAEIAGLDCNYITLQDYVPALDFYTPILASRNDYLAENPERAKAFLSATAKGFEFAIENPDEAAQILLKYAPELEEELVLKSQRWMADQYKAEVLRWGEIDEARWKLCYDWMYEKGLLAKELGADGFTNAFLPE